MSEADKKWARARYLAAKLADAEKSAPFSIRTAALQEAAEDALDDAKAADEEALIDEALRRAT